MNALPGNNLNTPLLPGPKGNPGAGSSQSLESPAPTTGGNTGALASLALFVGAVVMASCLIDFAHLIVQVIQFLYTTSWVFRALLWSGFVTLLTFPAGLVYLLVRRPKAKKQPAGLVVAPSHGKAEVYDNGERVAALPDWYAVDWLKEVESVSVETERENVYD